MNTLENLKAAKALIEEGWTKGAYAREANGEDVCFSSDEATCYCVMGAMHRAALFGEGYPEMREKVISAALETKIGKELAYGTKGFSIPNFNDHPDTTKEDVIAVFDAAIKELTQ